MIEKERAVIKAAAILVGKMEAIHRHPSFESLFIMQKVRTGQDYDGPNYSKEFEDLQAALKALDEVECTGVAARWCPNCGECLCPDCNDLNHDTCPLHGVSSRHADPR